MNIERLPYLFARYHEGTLDPSEWEELKQWMDRDDLNNFVAEDLEKTYPLPASLHWDTASRQQAWHTIEAAKKNSAPAVHRIHFLRRGFFRYAAAAILILGLATAAYLWTIHKISEQTLANRSSRHTDVLPGGDRAVLTLADGSRIILDSAANGELANQGGVQVMKLANGQVVYDSKGLGAKEIMMNTMSTPKGGQYRLMLPDGSRVWLNAASSIRFPVAFLGAERKVKITGEAYFEVAQHKQQPFIVDVDGKANVQVLGTRFNVNAYADENALKATLISGSVRVLAGAFATSKLQPGKAGNNVVVSADQSLHSSIAAGNNVILKPGQQAEISEGNDRKIKIQAVNVDQALAWKNGFFDLEDLDIYAAMRQLERWYDIKVQYEGSVHKGVFHGKIFRNTNLSDVIELLQKMGVNCRLEGKTLIVL